MTARIPRGVAHLEITFILPTRNRKEWVCRAIESCLAVQRQGITVEMLIIDGRSTDGSFELLAHRYGQDPRVRLVQQGDLPGFMGACFQSIPLLRTEFVTFMYDDDVLSPFWGDMPEAMRECEADFAMGFSAEEDLHRVFPFPKITRILQVTPASLLRAYHGCGHDLSKHSLPFSPICCVTRSEVLRDWVEELRRFTHGRALREHFMIKRNAGPDLMIYLFSILRHERSIPLFDGPVAQFSAHEASITSGLGGTGLLIGYWLAQRWACEHLLKRKRSGDAGWCAAYTVKKGIRIFLKKCSRFEGKWTTAFGIEVLALAARTLASRAAFHFLLSFGVLLLPRRWRPQFGLFSAPSPLLP